MSASIPEKYVDLFSKAAMANLATLMPDGSPQVTPVWCDFDGTNVLVNTAKDRVKDRNMRRDPRVSLDILDPANPYRYMGVQGRVVEMIEAGADDHIDKLAKKYLGKDKYPFRTPTEVRVIVKIQPEKVHGMG